MKIKLLLTLLLGALWSSSLLAEDVRYVSDQLGAPLRSSPCGNCKIIHWWIESGSKLTLIGTQDGWSNVKTNTGLEGWMEDKLLLSEPVARDQLATISSEMEKLRTRNSELESVMTELRSQSQALRGELDSSEGSNENLAAELSHIREISSDALALNQQNQELVQQNQILQQEFDVLQANYEDLQRDKSNESFLYGGLTVFLGAILVVLIPKLRGRKRFSEWG